MHDFLGDKFNKSIISIFNNIDVKHPYYGHNDHLYIMLYYFKSRIYLLSDESRLRYIYQLKFTKPQKTMIIDNDDFIYKCEIAFYEFIKLYKKYLRKQLKC